jgi:transcriptional regulator with XRE-family HTH domain
MNITGDRLRKLRKEKSMSQEEVANSIGISRTAYNKYESGVIKPVRKLTELSRLFGVTTDFILGQDESEAPVAPGKDEFYQKYMALSSMGKNIVDITLNAVYEKEFSKKF